MNQKLWQPTLGANFLDDRTCRFRVWAPSAKTMDLHIEGSEPPRVEAMKKEDEYFDITVAGLAPGSEYFYVIDRDKKRPDPASRHQPKGVHGPSQAVISHNFKWDDAGFVAAQLPDAIFYELHVGTFTREGTFDAIIPRLPQLKALGVNIVEIMPVAQNPGSRNWGYDGVYPYAVQNSFGGPEGLKKLVNACHREGLGVCLDVVYNHIGPEGNYLRDFGPYFTDHYHTPWGDAINFDGAYSDGVRQFFIENAMYWVSEFHVDALRLDAVHAIVDNSAVPFIEELATRVHTLGKDLNRPVHVIAEDDRNDARVVTPVELGGHGLDGQWSDDFHHSLHSLITGERNGYYEDFGSIEHLATAYSQGYVYTGQYSKYRHCRHGSSPREIKSSQLVVCAQNHDQVGNRAKGDRISTIVSFDRLKLAAGVLLLSPFVPLLFMGEEYGETAPFQYFVSHSDEELIRAVREGRRKEFSRFEFEGELPDPQSEETFARSTLSWELREKTRHQRMLALYTELIKIRKTIPALRNPRRHESRVWARGNSALLVERWHEDDRVLAAFNFGPQRISIEGEVPLGKWKLEIDSLEAKWSEDEGPAPAAASEPEFFDVAPESFRLFHRSEKS
jgi:maltooligosyltrehalose trehalohydrolase